jgi:hypothetical protein
MRKQVNAQLDRDFAQTRRLQSIRLALKKDPKNKKLKRRLKDLLLEDQKERETLINIAKNGDTCSPCRTRVLSVMENAIAHGFEEKRLPDYMQSYCEVRLAITGSTHSLRDINDINAICLKFKNNLIKDLKESLNQQLNDERLDSLTLMPSESSPSHMIDGSKKPVRYRQSHSEGHNATLHAYCRAISDCGPPPPPPPPPSSNDNTTTSTKNVARPPVTECDRCASNLMGTVNAWRTNYVDITNAVLLRSNYMNHFQNWCRKRLDATWTVRKDLIPSTCNDASMVPSNDDDAVTPENDYLFNPITWKALSGRNQQAHRDLIQLYHVCTTIGECTHKKKMVTTTPGATTPGAATPGAATPGAATPEVEGVDEEVEEEKILPSEEEQDKINRLLEESNLLKKRKKDAEDTLKKANAMEYDAKRKESKMEEIANEQSEASDRCYDNVKLLENKYNTIESRVDKVCMLASKSETRMEHVKRQLKTHQEQYKTLAINYHTMVSDCEKLRKTKFVEYQAVKKNERKILTKCVTNANSQIHKYTLLKNDFNTNPNYPAGSDLGHPNIQQIEKKLNELNKAIEVCEQNEVMNVAKGLEVREKSDTQCQSSLGSMKQAQLNVKSIEKETEKKSLVAIQKYDDATKVCKINQKEQNKVSIEIKDMKLKCSAADKLKLTTKKRSAAAAAAAAAIEVSKAVAEAEEEALEGASATGGFASVKSSDATGLEEESSNAADTYGGCALDVMAYARKVKKSLKTEKKSLWTMVGAWALKFCKAEAEDAKSRALLTGKPFSFDIETACNFASNVFMSASIATELEISIKFCKTIRQFTGRPQNGISYDRQKLHLLPKAPLSLRPEALLSPYIYGPGPISKTNERSDMEWYGTNEETTRLRHNKYGRGNLDYLMAPHEDDLASRVDQPRRVVISIEESFAKKWKMKQKRNGVHFMKDVADIILEPNRQLKVTIPKYRYVNDETGSGENSESGAATGGSR